MTKLRFNWTISRARDTAGYNVCTLRADGRKVAGYNGGGYDMKGACLGDWIAEAYSDRLLALKPEDMPENSHWERAEKPRRICGNAECSKYGKTAHPSGKVAYFPDDETDTNCPECGEWTRTDATDGKRIDDGRGFYGLTFHDPNFDPGKAIIGKDCHDRTLGGNSTGATVEEREAAGVSLGLERLQAFYSASSKVPTKRHTVPKIDGACGWSSVERIAKAIGLTFERVGGSRRSDPDEYIVHDERVACAV